MSNALFVAELLYIITFCISSYVAYEFYKSDRNSGYLRILLIFHFISQAWVSVVNGIFFYFFERGYSVFLDIGATRIISLTPLAASLILILEHIKNKNKHI